MGDIYVELARQSLTSYIKDGKKLKQPEGLPEELTGRRAGAFYGAERPKHPFSDPVVHGRIDGG